MTAARHYTFQPYRTSWAVWIGIASSLILSAVMILGVLTTDSQNGSVHAYTPSLNHFNIPFLCISNAILLILLYLTNFWIMRIALSDPYKVAICFVAFFAVAWVYTELSFRIETLIYGEGKTSNSFSITLIANMAAGLIAFLISMLISNIMQHQRIVLENERLQRENLLNRYQTMQQQISPHYFFNSLNTLDGLIGLDTDRAHSYLQQLAATFRYSMQEQHEVSLADELEFTHAYIYMMQIRHGENLIIKERIDHSLLSRRMPSISLQLLVENAIKHNVISSRHPLTITIKSGVNSLIVTNPIQPKSDSEESTGIGLNNLSQRYQLLYHRDIKINESAKKFSVEIPLI